MSIWSDFVDQMYAAWLNAGQLLRTRRGKVWYAPRGLSATQDGAYSILSLMGDQPITQPCTVHLSWTGAPPPVMGFDVNFVWNGQTYNIPIRHTYTGATDTQMNALGDMQQQFVNNPTIRQIYGSYEDGLDILDYTLVRTEQAAGEPPRLTFFGHCQMNIEAQMSVVAAAGCVVDGVDATTHRMSPLPEVAPFVYVGRSWKKWGKYLPAGSLLGGICFGMDMQPDASKGVDWETADARNASPMPATIIVRLIDPATGLTEMIFTADYFSFQRKGGTYGADVTFQPGPNHTFVPVQRP